MPASTIEAAGAAPGDGYGGAQDQALSQATAQVQSNVLRSMNPQVALHLFFRITNVSTFRNFVGLLVNPPDKDFDHPDPRIKIFLAADPSMRRIWREADAHVFGEGERTPRSFSWNLAFTWTGLKALEINKVTLASFPEDFRDGMAPRAGRLGDVGASSPERWEGWLGNRETHGLLSILFEPSALPKSADPAGLAAAGGGRIGPLAQFKWIPVIAFLVATIQARQLEEVLGFSLLHVEGGQKIIHAGGVDGPYRIEHFGFRDGVSQPFADAGLLGTSSSGQVVPVPPPPGGGTARPGGTWEPIALGELLLGRADEDGIKQFYPSNAKLRNDGTYMVFRKLEQDVIGFRRYLARHDATAGRESRLAAQMVGRWPNGTSLVRAPDFPADELPKRAVNDFRYRDEDPRGQRCPIAAHARRLNPRDSNNRDEARRHRIWRRSITYGGPFLDYGAPDDGRERGLLFIALCARIDQQFEFLQTRWLNGGEFAGHAGIARCPLTGANSGDVQDSFVAPGRPAPYTHLPRFVTTKGGDYFFMPSIPALAEIAAGGTFPSIAAPEGDNPAINETPKVVDPDALVALGRTELLPPDRPGWIEHKGVVLVGRHALVCRVLGDDRAFPASEQDVRIRRMTGGERLMLGLPVGESEHKTRLAIWRKAAANHYGPSPGAIAAQAMQAVLARHGPAGRIDLVRDVSLLVPLAVARYYFGVRGPEAPSASHIASQYNKLDITQVPRDWLAVLPHLPPQDVPFATLAAWAQLGFAEVFVNVANARDLAALAARTTAELFRHLDRLVDDADPRNPSTLLGCMVALDPRDFGLTPERFRVVIRLLLAEMTVAGAGTLAEALPSAMNYLLDHPDDLQMACEALAKAAREAKDAKDASAAVDATLDAVIREALRFDPVGPILFRRCVAGTELRIPADSTVAVLLKTAMFDPDAFPDPDSFCIDALKRPEANYLHFGHGPHYCKGADIATPVLREMARAIIGLKDLRRAAGPLGNVFDSLGRYQSLVVRFTP